MTSYYETVFWNSRTYGSALKLDKGILRTIFVVACILTPFTNWAIPFVTKLISKDIMIRYDK